MSAPRCGIYVRISRDDAEVKGLGVARQEADCRALADGNGWTVEAVFSDNDVSAFSGRRRPGYEDLLEALKAGQIDAIVAWHPDRLHRSPRELEGFIDAVEAAGATVATVQAGELDLSTAAGRMTARVVGAVARHESEQKSERQRRKATELAMAGKVGGGGDRPFGYEDDRVTVRESEAQVLRDIVARILAGGSIRGVAAYLTRSGVTSTAGNEWYPTTLRRLLMSPRIAGLREHRGVVVGEAAWPAIIDREQHEALVRILSDPARTKRTTTSRSYLLSGVARCALCGANLVARPRSDKRRAMVCSTGPGFKGCGKIRTLAEPMEELITEAVLLFSDTPQLAQAIHAQAEGPIDGLGDEIARLERRLDELAETWAAGEIDKRSWLTASEAIRKHLDEAKRQAALAGGARVLSDAVDGASGVRGAWPELSVDERRSVIQAVINHVDVHPAVKGNNRFNPDRFEIIWAV